MFLPPSSVFPPQSYAPAITPSAPWCPKQSSSYTARSCTHCSKDSHRDLHSEPSLCYRDARGAGAERKVLQQRLGALQTEVEHLKDDLDATVGHIHAAAQQSLQFLSFNKALQVGWTGT